MRLTLVFILCILIVPSIGNAQIPDNIDDLAPFHEDLAAVKKGDTWGFINLKGELVIDYRDDLVWTLKGNSPFKASKEAMTYPHFSHGRCLIKKNKDDIDYYGYIDNKGKIVIAPNFIDATNFDKGHAIVLKLYKEELGKNDVLDKKVLSYSYNEIAIDANGDIKGYLHGPKHLTLKSELKALPRMQSYIATDHLAVTKLDNGHWKITTLKVQDLD